MAICIRNLFAIGLIAVAASIPGKSFAFVGGENWDYENAAKGVDPSGTLPVLHINTADSVPVDQKENYIDGEYWLDPSGIVDVEAVGSADAPLPLEIRGRGNATWLEDKKPYKLKLGKKQSLLGMPKNKHYALLTFIGGFSAYFAHPLGMEIGRHIIQGWTPRMSPVEVVLNGQYIGLYTLAETVRIDSGRVDIFEQPEGNEDASTLDGGYLVEIDNYIDSNQLILQENDSTELFLTVSTPEPMTEAQAEFLVGQFNDITKALYDPDKLSRRWEELIDADSYARHFVVQEIMNNQDAYNGSCKMHKDLDGKWTFGPLLDIGDTFDLIKEDFTFNTTPFRKTWIPQTYQFPRFVKRVQEVYREFKEIDPATWDNFIDNWNASIYDADLRDQKVWKYNRNTTTADKAHYTKHRLTQKIEWLDNQWGDEPLTHNVSVFITGDGTALLGGHEYPDVDVFVGDDLAVALRPAEGLVIHKLHINGMAESRDHTENGAFLLKGISDDIHIDVEYAVISSLADNETSSPSWRVEGGVVKAYSPVEVFDIVGSLIGIGTNITLPGKGIYIIRAGANSIKIIN